MPEHSTVIAIASAGLSAQIDTLGAQLFTLKDASGRDLLWDGDPAFWTGRSPILFPIVGALAGGEYRLDGQTYVLPRHGFARTKRFEVAEATAVSATFTLRSDAETLRVYPFTFALAVTFAIDQRSLTITASVSNPGERPLPASFGFHPAFRWPLPYGRPRADHAVRFAKDESAPIRRIDGQGLVKPDGEATPVVEDELDLRDDLFADDAVIFDRLNSASLYYGAKDGPSLQIDFPDTPYLGLWSKPGAPFVAIEPWHGIADPQGFSGDFRDKPGMFEVAPGAVRRMSIGITLSSDPL
jgi:galactose mutarotase-like enzyme